MKKCLSYILSISLVFLLMFSCIQKSDVEGLTAVVRNPIVIQDTIYMSNEEWNRAKLEKESRNNTDPVIVYDTVYMTLEEWDKMYQETSVENDTAPVVVYDTVRVTLDQWNNIKQSKETKASPKAAHLPAAGAVVTEDYANLKQFNVVVASLSKEVGVESLSKAFKEAGIDCYIVKNPYTKLYHFVVYSSDSETDAVAARKKFLSDHVSNTSSQDILKRYHVRLSDTFVWRKKN